MRAIRVARARRRCFPPPLTLVVVCPGPLPVLYPFLEDSVKVHSKRGSGITAFMTGVAVVAVIASATAGTGLVPPRTAQAQVPEQTPRDTAATQLLLPAEPQPKVDVLREPSGLEVAEIQATGTRTPTVVRKPRPAAPRPVAASSAPTGDGWRSARASWYGPGFYGNGMAGGGTLQPDSMVVAHRSLPFGTLIEFSYRGNTCVAVVQDRGPYAGGRVFDLGPGTARALGFSGVGTVQYRIISQ